VVGPHIKHRSFFLEIQSAFFTHTQVVAGSRINNQHEKNLQNKEKKFYVFHRILLNQVYFHRRTYFTKLEKKNVSPRPQPNDRCRAYN
jgi:hypothetical protein